jgi:hypothetical protein
MREIAVEHVEHHVEGEQRLFQAVIIQAIKDCRSNGGLGEDARNWIFTNNPHFHLACDIACMHPSSVRRMARIIAGEGHHREKQAIKNQKRR